MDYYPQLDGIHDKSKPEWAVLPRAETKAKADETYAEFSCFQYFPSVGPTASVPSPPKSETDRNFSLYGRVAGNWTVASGATAQGISLAGSGNRIFAWISRWQPRATCCLRTTLDGAAAANVRDPWISLAQDHAL